ncbi:discoidin domain-containing protein, partial [Dysgonomonas gadei]|uniref:discoidin domain-containing protein n=1 Tax=Dysgonomonas gadei TaxID=156974 RepID=UPI003AF1CDF7
VDMLQPQKFNKIHLDYTESPNDGPDKYEIYVSDDGELWGEPIASGGGTKSTLKIELDDQEARYIRILQTGTNEGGYWSIHEFWAYNNEKEIGTVKFEIIPTPSNATVQINGIEQSIVTIEKGKNVTYRVSAEGYIAVEDTRSNLQSDTRIEVKLEAISVPKVRFEIVSTPSSAIVIINGIEQRIVEIEKGKSVIYKVSAEGYLDAEGTVSDIQSDTRLEINLDPIPVIRFEIIPTPSDATVIMNGSEQKTIEIQKGQDVTYKVSAEGYIPEEKTVTNIQSDKQLKVILNPIVSDPDKEISFSYDGHHIKVRGTTGEFRLRVYSVSGKCLIDNTTKGDVPFICPASGVYILRLDYEGSKYEKKVFLNK